MSEPGEQSFEQSSATAERLLGAFQARARAHPWRTLATIAILAAAGLAVASTLRPSAAVQTFLPGSSAGAQATNALYRSFGEEPVEVLVQGSLQRVLLGEDIDRLLGLEGCLAGRPPGAAATQAMQACRALAHLKAVKLVIGPGTFVNEAALKIDEELAAAEARAQAQAREAQRTVRARALAAGEGTAAADALAEEARKATLEAFGAEVATLALRYGITSTPALNNREFVSSLVFAKNAQPGTPKQRFAYLFPSRNLALISVRLRAGLGEGERAQAIGLIRRVVAGGQFRLQGATYSVTGEPVLVSELTERLSSAVELLLLAALVAMALALGLLFDLRPRLLPLLLALAAGAIGFGLWALVGGTLSLGTLAVLPILVGLAVDYGVQIQSRIDGRPRGALSVALAALASAGAMLTLLLSPVPAVHSFSILLIGGIAISFLVAVGASAAVGALRSGERPPLFGGRLRRHPGSPPLGRLWGADALSSSWIGARELLREGPLPALVSRVAFALARRWAGRTLIVGAVLAAAGLALSTQIAVQSDITKLVPGNLPALRSLEVLERESGIGGQISVLVEGSDVSQPRVVQWMRSYQQRVLSRFGASAAGSQAGSGAEAPACAQAKLCPAFSLPDLLSEAQTSGSSRPAQASAAELDGLLRAIPPYFSQSVISADHRQATLAFGIRLMPLARQQQVIEAMRLMLHAPAGIDARLAGVAVLAAQANADISSASARAVALLASLLAAAVVLLILFGGAWRRALSAFLPVLLASGWAALGTWASGIELNPLSATFSVLVVAIAIELSVLLSERYREELSSGTAPQQALGVAYARTGSALATSALSAIAGFAVLALSSIKMLQGFGLVTIVDLAIALVGVLLVMPSVLLVLGEDRPSDRPRKAGNAQAGTAQASSTGAGRAAPV